MPVVLFIEGFRFFFYSNESGEPVHIYVIKGDANGKIWLEPTVEPAYLHDFSPREAKRIMEIVNDNSEMFKNKWYEYFSK